LPWILARRPLATGELSHRFRHLYVFRCRDLAFITRALSWRVIEPADRSSPVWWDENVYYAVWFPTVQGEAGGDRPVTTLGLQ
jgi:hypothetical protein